MVSTAVYPPAGGWFQPLTHLTSSKNVLQKARQKYKNILTSQIFIQKTK
jgi:hypothetical protein